MTTRPRIQHRTQFRFAMGVAILAGVFGLIIQCIPTGESPSSWDFLVILEGIGALTGIVGIQKIIDEREQQLLSQSFSLAFQWTFILLFVVNGIYIFSGFLGFLQGISSFLSIHWLGFTISWMCILLGLAGWRSYGEE
jgi:hypothetical protein